MENIIDNDKMKFLNRDELFKQIKSFTSNMKVTNDKFTMLIENCKLEDIEWNHMDQMHRPAIHKTYEKGVRIACGKDFAVSLTQWSKWPFFITVTDVYVEKGVFYQSLVIAGVLFVHSIITMEEIGNDVKLQDEWFIASKRLFSPIHWILNKKLHKLNYRLQMEDEQVRQGRFFLREKGYRFETDKPNYLNSNIVKHNTIYPMNDQIIIDISDIGVESMLKKVNEMEFIIRREKETYLIWPATCPHEGGPLKDGVCENNQIICPWHELKFAAVVLTTKGKEVTRYGFQYTLKDDHIEVIRKDQKFNCISIVKEQEAI